MAIRHRIALAVLALAVAAPLGAEDSTPRRDLSAELEAAEDRLTSQVEYLLRYKFAAGETMRWKVVHLVTTDTKISGNSQTSKSRSVSTKCWHVGRVTEDGQIAFKHSVENVDMWQQVSDRPEVAYNSQKDGQPPPEYEQVAKTVGQTLAEVTIQSDGQIIQKDSDSPRLNLGMGDVVMLLPPKPVRIGSHWYEPGEIQVRQADKTVQRIKTRKLYTLEKVQTGVATISLKTEVLTPVDDPRSRPNWCSSCRTARSSSIWMRVGYSPNNWIGMRRLSDSAAPRVRWRLARLTEELLPAEASLAGRGPAEPKLPAGSTTAAPSTARAGQPAGPAPRR